MKYTTLVLFFFLSFYSNAQNIAGVYESVVPERVKEVITLSANNKYEEQEYRWREGQWKLKCTYKGIWSVANDTLKTKPNEVIWAMGMSPLADLRTTTNSLAVVSAGSLITTITAFGFLESSRKQNMFTSEKSKRNFTLNRLMYETDHQQRNPRL